MQVIYHDTVQIQPIAHPDILDIDTLLLSGESQEIKKFYKTNEYKIGWTEEENRMQLLEVLKNLKTDGIPTEQFPIAKLEEYNKDYAELSDQEKMKADILFANNYSLALNQLYNGVLNARKLYNDWDIDAKNLSASSTMVLALDNKAVEISFDSIRPAKQVYTRMRSKLTDLYELNSDSLQVFKNTTVNINDTLSQTSTLVNHLIFLNYLSDSISSASAVYTPAIADGIKQLQNKHKLKINGIADEKTMDALVSEVNMVKEKLIVNLERWRWFPREFGEYYILINIPNYSLVAVSENDTLQSHKIVVGKKDRKTPVLSSQLTTIVLNPTWTVPPTILKNDLTPKASADRSYFTKQNFTIYNAQGKVVSAEEWDPSKARSYRYVQKGGPGNTLGRIKFLFKNNHAVYLHDTPSKWNFDIDKRSLSSGCVRVQDPFDLAQYVFEIVGNNISQEKINEILKSEKTNNISVSKVPVQIHQLYWTIQIDKNGKIKLLDDLYDLDKSLYKKLNASKE